MQSDDATALAATVSVAASAESDSLRQLFFDLAWRLLLLGARAAIRS